MKKLVATVMTVGLLVTSPAKAGMLTASAHASCSPHTLAERDWPYDRRVKYWREWLSLMAASEDARKTYSAEWALWELKKPTIPRAYAGYDFVSYWGLIPFRLKYVAEPRVGAGFHVRGLSAQHALAFVREHRVALGVPTAPELVELVTPVIDSIQDCYTGFREPPPIYMWYFAQRPSKPSGASCDGCGAEVAIDRRTLQVVSIDGQLIDLPHAPMPAPRTTAEEALARFREMRPGALLPKDPKVHLSYVQDVFGGVDLAWEIAVSQDCGGVGGSGLQDRVLVQWVALDARNLAIRGYDGS